MINKITIGGNTVSVVSFPTSQSLQSIQIDFSEAVETVRSPWTGQTQTQQWVGAEMWMATCTAPPLTQAQADDYLSFLMSCRGMSNAFLMGDPLKSKPSGSVDSRSIPVVNGATAIANYLLWSGGFSNSAWSRNQISTVLDNTIAAPDGSLTASAISAVASPTDAFLAQGFSGFTIGEVVTFSVWLNAPGIPSHQLAIQINDGTTDSVTLCSLGHGWQRYSVTHTLAATSFTVYIGGAMTMVDPNEGIYAAWAQLEKGTLATPYEATTTTAYVVNTNVSGATAIYARGFVADAFGLLNAGDYLQHGYRLHRVMNRVNSDSNGDAVIYIWPSIREAAADGDPIILNNPKGLFRLANNKQTWSSDYTGLTRVSFQVQEYR